MSDQKFAVKKHLTMPQLKLAIGVPSFVKILDAVRISTVPPKAELDAAGHPTGKTEKPAEVCSVIDLEGDADTPFTMIVNAVFKSEIEKGYPGQKYVGKKFRIVKGPKAQGKRYNTFAIAELE